VQQALLKLVEGTRCRITPTGGRKHPNGETVEIDTTNIMFIAGGAFVGLDNIVKNRMRGTSIGFRAQVTSDRVGDLNHTTPEDLIKFGMIPEFVGRFPSWVALQELNLEDLISILTDVKHSYIDQYCWLFRQDQIELKFQKSALEQIAKNTMKNRTGARGLHSELERVLLPHMYNLVNYRDQGIKEIYIDLDLVNTPRELKVDNEQIQRQVSNLN
jgi:ATP-dependent Clp protease ATP-binding subunit ClpX